MFSMLQLEEPQFIHFEFECHPHQVCCVLRASCGFTLCCARDSVFFFFVIDTIEP